MDYATSLGTGAVNVSGGVLDVTSAGLSGVSSLTIGSAGALNMAIGSPLTINGAAAFAGTLNVSGAAITSGRADLMNYSSYSGGFATANVPSGDTLQYMPTQLDLVPVSFVRGSWSSPSGGSWSGTGNWASGSVPGVNGNAAPTTRPPSPPRPPAAA